MAIGHAEADLILSNCSFSWKDYAVTSHWQKMRIILGKNKNSIVHNIIQYLNQNIDKKITLEHWKKHLHATESD